MFARMGWIIAVTLVLAACDAEPDDSGYLACGEACDACGLGYCVAGGGSGHCSNAERRQCIIDASDCDALRVCVSGPLPDAGP